MVSYFGIAGSASQTTDQLFAKLNACLGNQCQSAVKCGICCSTMREAWVPTCNHPFCRECITQCFNLKTKIECPICRQIISKRGSVASPSIDQLVKLYLQVASRFKSEINTKITMKLPNERQFLESQALSQSDGPLRDFKLPQFAVPAQRKRKTPSAEEENRPAKKAKEELNRLMEAEKQRKEALKARQTEKRGLEVVVEETEEQEDLNENRVKKGGEEKRERKSAETPPVSSTFATLTRILPILPARKKDTLEKGENTQPIESRDVEIQTESFLSPLHPMQLNNLVNETRKNHPELSQVAALFHALPWIKDLLRDNTGDVLGEIPELLQPKRQGGSEFDDDVFDEEEIVVPLAHPPESRESRTTSTTGDCVPATPSGSDELVLDDEDKPDKENVKKEAADEEAFGQAKALQPNGGSRVQVLREDEIKPEPVSEERNLADGGQRVLTASERGKMVIAFSCFHQDTPVIQKFGELFPDVTLTDEVEEGCTHLVMMNTDYDGISKSRSLKYVFAIARKCHIITKHWVEDCIARQEVIDWGRYNLLNDGDANHVTPWMKSRSSEGGLLEGKKFFVPKEYCDCTVVPRAKVVQLIELCGGQIVNKIWDVQDDCVILFAPGSKEVGDARRFEQDTKAPVVSVDYLLDNICEYKTTPWKVAGHRIWKGRRSAVFAS